MSVIYEFKIPTVSIEALTDAESLGLVFLEMLLIQDAAQEIEGTIADFFNLFHAKKAVGSCPEYSYILL